MRTRLPSCFLLTVLFSTAGWAQRVGQTPPATSQRTAAPVAQRPGAGGDHPETTAGSVEGFVYWDTHAIRHNPENSCDGLAITVSVGSSSGGPLTAYTPLGTLSNNFKYVGQVKEFLVGGKIIVYDVCTYAYDKVPVGPPLQVKLTIADPSPFLPNAAPPSGILGPITIINGQCNMLPRIVNPTASDLSAHWGSCQNMAYDVNFSMLPPARANLPVGITPADSSQRSGMLSKSPQSGILGSAGSTTQLLPANGGPTESRGVPSSVTGTASPASKVELNPQPLPPRVQMKNADVLNMLRGGVPESVILSSIHSAAHNFDFSVAGCQELKAAHVTAQILAAMGDGSVRPCGDVTGSNPSATPAGNVELNPQPLPPGAKAAPINRAALKPIKLAPPKALRKVTNPRLAEQNAILGLLQQQRDVAQQEASAMKTGTRSVASVASVRAPAATTFRDNTAVPNIGPETTQSEKGKLPLGIAQAPIANSMVLICANDPTPRIIRLSGGEGPGVFTPEAKYNLYTITGCGFGPSASGNSAYIFGVNGFNANLNIDFWSDNGITVHLDPWFSGVFDQDNVTLVVAPSGKQPLNKSGYKFYAARGMPGPDGSDQEVQLAYDSMPQSRTTLASVSKFISGFDRLPTNATSMFPSFSFQGTPVLGWVFRFASGHKDLVFQAADCFINDIVYNDEAFCVDTVETTGPWTPKPDTWDLSELPPGFAVSSYQLFYDDTDPKALCSAWEGEHYPHVIGSAWDSSFSQNQITVTWLAYQCFEEENEGLNYRDETTLQSSYGLAVWVLGPRCIDPWTGQKDQACMNTVKQTLS